MAEENIYEDGADVEDQEVISYDVTTSPNDFNTLTLCNFLETGVVKIPSFQRNYVWDLKRASKFIESLLLGLPIPQLFLFEQEKNKFLVIDGQQRYFTIYYFMKNRFPKKEKRVELRKYWEEGKGLPECILSDDAYFTDFKLNLPTSNTEQTNKYHGKKYSTLDENDKIAFNLRVVRNIFIKQNNPDDGNSAMFEIFNRLNTGGINLKPQEIRASLYDSDFYQKLFELNLNPDWRQLTTKPEPDLNMFDIEIILRALAFVDSKDKYQPSLSSFINRFSKKAKKFEREKIEYIEKLFKAFLSNMVLLDNKIFFNEKNRFLVPLFEVIFYATCHEAYTERSLDILPITVQQIKKLKNNQEFNATLQSGSYGSENVKRRLDLAEKMLKNE